MSGTTDAVTIDGTGLRIGIARATFNEPITSGLLEGALAAVSTAGAEADVVDVPGAFELPLIAQRMAAGGYDAVVALGAVILGETDHYDHVAHRASEGLMRVALDTGVPVAFGILTAREAQQAAERSAPGADNKGAEAANAAMQTALLPHLHENGLTAARAAQICGFKVRRLARDLRAEGTTITREIARLRAQRAADDLLYTNKRVAEIGNAVGFSDPTMFSRAFKSWMGQSPQRFRQTHKSSERRDG